jgi:hypothetical protein
MKITPDRNGWLLREAIAVEEGATEEGATGEGATGMEVLEEGATGEGVTGTEDDEDVAAGEDAVSGSGVAVVKLRGFDERDPTSASGVLMALGK